MNMPARYVLGAMVALAGLLGLPERGLALGESFTNGYICEPKNPGGEETRLYFRQQDGVAINLSSSATFPVVCPVIIPFELPPYEAMVVFKNGSDMTQKFQCALEEYNAITFEKMRSTGKAITLAPGEANMIAYENIELLDYLDYLSLRCIIPPRGMIGLVEFF